MTDLRDADTEELLRRIAGGDAAAHGPLLQRHRTRLRRMIELRLDRRLRARVDPSDVVQETLAQAAGRLSEYARARPLPFFPWLRRLACERLIDLQRLHLRAQRRSVRREDPQGLPLSDESVAHLAGRLAARGSSPSAGVRHEERRALLREALGRLPQADCEVLLLRYVEDLSVAETAAVLGLTESAVKMRHLRALRRLRELLGENAEEQP
jgi:RNA polymerase sigma-70 factor (ECF subfamily)